MKLLLANHHLLFNEVTILAGIVLITLACFGRNSRAAMFRGHSWAVMGLLFSVAGLAVAASITGGHYAIQKLQAETQAESVDFRIELTKDEIVICGDLPEYQWRRQQAQERLPGLIAEAKVAHHALSAWQ